ncbi:TPA: hypothetical protein HA278_07460 [Candidatus Woesearchaeota archaeon]|nr:hypothetical protein [Candidatus Woesearchaeota archaeon]
MSQETIDVLEALATAYEKDPCHESSTFWGIAMYGSLTTEREPHFELVDRVLDGCENLVEPEYTVSRRRFPAIHRELTCLANRDQLEEYLERTLGSQFEAYRGYVDDSLLCNDVFTRYLKDDIESDFITFALHYDIITNSETKFEGSYRSLMKRLVFRYGEEALDDSIYTGEKGKNARYKHQQKVFGEPISENLRVLYESEIGNGLATVTRSPGPRKIIFPGPRRVYVRGVIGVDWSDLLERRGKRIWFTQQFNMNNLMRNRI